MNATKNHKKCNKAVDNYPHALEFVPGCYKAQRMCYKAFDTHLSTIKFVPECFMTQDMCDKAVNRCFFVFDSLLDWYKTQEMCDRNISENPSLMVYCSDEYIIQRKNDQAADYSLAALKLISDWFVTRKMIKKLYMQMKIYSILIKILVILILIIILTMMILMLLFLSTFG